LRFFTLHFTVSPKPTALWSPTRAGEITPLILKSIGFLPVGAVRRADGMNIQENKFACKHINLYLLVIGCFVIVL